jgi:hypothetical protein
MLRFLGEDGSEGLSGGDARAAEPVVWAPFERRHALRARLFVRGFRRNGDANGNGSNESGRGSRSELVSERWSPAHELRLELDRSRRFGHPFALVGIWCRPKQERWGFLREFATALDTFVRRVDRVWIQGSGVYVLLPECDRTMLEATLERLRDPLSRLLGEDTRTEVSAAVFPEDGLTSRALLSALDVNRDAMGLRPRGTLEPRVTPERTPAA